MNNQKTKGETGQRKPLRFIRLLSGDYRISFASWNTRSPNEGTYHRRLYWHKWRLRCSYGYRVPKEWRLLPLYLVDYRELNNKGWLLGD